MEKIKFIPFRRFYLVLFCLEILVAFSRDFLITHRYSSQEQWVADIFPSTMGLLTSTLISSAIIYGIYRLYKKITEKKEAKMDVERTQKESEPLIGVIDAIDNVLADSIGDPKLVIAGGHDAIATAQKVCDEIQNEILPEFNKNEVGIIHLFYILNSLQTMLMTIDRMVS